MGWYDVTSGGNKLFSGSTFLTPILTATTTFYAEAQSEGCSSYPRTAVTASLINSINDRADLVKVTLYPNPTHDYVILSIYGLMEPAKLEIRDVRGRLLKIVEIEPYGPDYIKKIDLLSFEQGIYNFILMNKRVNKTFRVVKF